MYLYAMSDEPVQSTNTEFSRLNVESVSKYASSAALFPPARRAAGSLMSSPCLSTTNLRLFESPHTCRRFPVRSAIFSPFLAMISTSALPTTPKPAMNRLMSLPDVLSKNSLWIWRIASFASFDEMMMDTFLSDEPWAVARTGMLWRPRAASIRPVVPLWLRTSSPTRHTIEKPFSTFNGLSLPREISYAKHLSAASLAFSASFSETAIHIVCTEDAWVIRMMFTSF